MIRTWKRLLAITMVALILCGTFPVPESNRNVMAATESYELTSDKVKGEILHQDTKEKRSYTSIEYKERPQNDYKDDGEKKESEQRSVEQSSVDEDGSSKDGKNNENENKNEEKNTEEEEESDRKNSSNSEQDADSGQNVTDKDSSEEKATENTEASEQTTEESLEEDEKQMNSEYPEDSEDFEDSEEILMDPVEMNTFSTSGPHNIDMPDVTSHYFTLQKNSKAVASASGTYLKVVKDEKEASRYIYKEMNQGRLYNFTPRMTSSSTITVGGGNGGGVSLSTVKSGTYEEYGKVHDLAKEGRIQSKAFNLSKCSANPYAIYTNVGTWYDESSKMTYSVDMRLEVTGYLFPSKTIREQQSNMYKAPYIGFAKDMIGVIAMGTDYIQTSMTFYYHGTQTTISNLRGVIQFCDIDAQQGVDFGNGFEKIVMFKASGSHLQFYNGGIIGSSKGYVSSRVVTNLNVGDTRTTALGVFSGSKVSCRWTIAKCDHKDTGGKAAYAAKSGYGIPADSSQADAKSYYYSNSTGFLGIYADLGLIPPPGKIEKNEYEGTLDAQKSRTQEKELKLKDREEKVTFVLSTAAASPSDLSKAKYTSFIVEDHLEALFEKEGEVKIFTENVPGGTVFSEVTQFFTVNVTEESDHRSYVKVQATANALKSAAFYGKSYFIHIPVRIRSEKELERRGLSIGHWYQTDNQMSTFFNSGQNYQGTVAADNKGQLYVASNQGIEETLWTNEVSVRICMNVILRKYGDSENHPVAGIGFGLFGGKTEDYEESMKPLMEAKSDQNGYVRFEADTFYQKEFGDGPYFIREISIPEVYKNVWSPSIRKNWAYEITSLRDSALYERRETIELVEGGEKNNPQILWNIPYKNPKKKVMIYKKSTDTKEYLQGAEFGLYAWSESGKSYKKLMKLTEGMDEKGVPYYYNAESFANTMDNYGKYKVVEEKAPKGCVLSEKEWLFESNEDTKHITYTFENDLQKGIVKIIKEGEDGELLEGVKFRIKAAEDIYAPWALKEEEKDSRNLLVAQGTIMDTLITDQNGEVKSTQGHELYPGSYCIEEIEAATGYICDRTPHYVELKYSEDQTQKEVEVSTILKNTRMKPAMSVAKLADHTQNQEGEAVSFDTRSGRYVDQKVAGVYQEKETVDYTITVTNTGNVDLYDMTITDSMDQPNTLQGYALKDFVQENTAHFDIPEKGYYISAKGERVNVTLGDSEEKNPMVLCLDHLAVGDAVAVHFKLQVKDKAANAYVLRNEVLLKARYEEKQGENITSARKDVDTSTLFDADGNSLVKDWDDINIPGIPEARVAKLADRTTGASLVKGRYEGKKMEGTYEYGENVDFTIHVTNYGTADIYQILVEDTLDGKLYQSLQPDSIVFEEGTYVTNNGQNVHAIGKKEEDPAKRTLLLDYLQAGDSVELHLYGKVKSGVKADSSLKNNVVISAEYQSGPETFESVPPTPLMKDYDTITIGVPDLVVAKKADKTTGVTLKNGRFEGKKKTAVYDAGETVIYSLTVSNTGKGIAKNVIVEEAPSASLLKYVAMKGFSYQKEEVLTTTKGNLVKVEEVEEQRVVLSELQAGDSIVLNYEGKVKEKIEAQKNLPNVVRVGGKNIDGTPIPEGDKMKDQDQIQIRKSGEKKDSFEEVYRTPPKTGDDSDFMRYLFCGGSAFLGLGYCFFKRKRAK